MSAKESEKEPATRDGLWPLFRYRKMGPGEYEQTESIRHGKDLSLKHTAHVFPHYVPLL